MWKNKNLKLYKLVAVTIPIYKEIINEYEIASLKQCLKILVNYPIIFFAPNSLNIDFYKAIIGKNSYSVERFEDKYFASISGYNKLMLNKKFYHRFKTYKYILIYQLDAFVFRDELTAWCNKGYDYIGAPYLTSPDEYPMKILTKFRICLRLLNKLKVINYKYRHVGNGGFCLRNTKKSILFLKIFNFLIRKWVLNEDSLFTHYGNVIYPIFKLAPEYDALSFSFENEPQKSFELNNYKLPFGCHAFSSPSNLPFWENFLDI